MRRRKIDPEPEVTKPPLAGLRHFDWKKDEESSREDHNETRPSVAWANVITDTLRITDPPGLARRLRDELSLGDGRTQYGLVLEALDRSARNLDDAGRLFRASRVEEERLQAAVNQELEVLRTQAQMKLNEAWKAKERKAPTKQDIDDEMVSSWPDRVSVLRAQISEMHNSVRALENLRDAWASRCADLRIMADKARPVL